MDVRLPLIALNDADLGDVAAPITSAALAAADTRGPPDPSQLVRDVVTGCS